MSATGQKVGAAKVGALLLAEAVPPAVHKAAGKLLAAAHERIVRVERRRVPFLEPIGSERVHVHLAARPPQARRGEGVVCHVEGVAVPGHVTFPRPFAGRVFFSVFEIFSSSEDGTVMLVAHAFECLDDGCTRWVVLVSAFDRFECDVARARDFRDWPGKHRARGAVAFFGVMIHVRDGTRLLAPRPPTL